MQSPVLKIKSELTHFGLNPAQWLVQKISLQGDGTYVYFKSIKSCGLELKGILKRSKTQNFKLSSLEVCGI